MTSPQRGEARRGEGQGHEETGGLTRLRCAPYPTSPRWGEELETVPRDYLTGALGGLRVLHSTLRCCKVPSRHSLWLRRVYGHEINALADEKDTFAPLRRSSRQRVRLSHAGLCRRCTPEGAVAK
jgi:hypothetical protein